MANVIKHKFTSPKADGGDATLIRPSNWNDEHALAGGNHGGIFLRDTGASDGASWLSSVAAGAYLRSLGVGVLPAWSTLLLPNAAAKGALLIGNPADTLVALVLAASTGRFLRANVATGLPEWSTLILPNALTAGALLIGNPADTVAPLATGTLGQYLAMGASLPQWSGPRVPQNLLIHGSFENWGGGTAVVPPPWTLVGAGASVARTTAVKHGLYYSALTRAGTDCYLANLASEAGTGYFRGRTYTFGCWVFATVASTGRISINDGVGTTSSSYHTGNSTWQFLTVTRTLDGSATKLEVRCEVNGTNTQNGYDGAILVEDNFVQGFVPHPLDVLLAGTNVAEATTTSTVATDIKTITVDISVNEACLLIASIRKTSGHASAAQVGLKVNATQALGNRAWSNSANQGDNGQLVALIGRRSSLYGGSLTIWATHDSGAIVLAMQGVDSNMSFAAITSLTITGLLGSALNTMGVEGAQVFRLPFAV
jgi:hypothetical protein